MKTQKKTKTTKKAKKSTSRRFFDELTIFRNKFPMVYIEAWTPGDFVPDPEDTVDWDDECYIAVADQLYDNFDANVGTNWFGIQEAVSGA
jgi:hypothetical protein